ncbi:PTS IIA-like nitrogen regulatory protein PtsN [Kordiimonas pumila]|uniref:PTS IIA-like nitrogen regulatory protein PtsN n=1 Tax=Kordiimonas pumila TaxID=2161677 RepID=A0ABV7DA74_9PROT|nr:PTS IIA-like nitrogen regulatory protein PtsN [Kordiimonas pumila]
MEIEDLLNADSILLDFKASSKKHVIQTLARKMATKTGLDDRLVFEKLLERERLGSTGVGKGVAIPHARVAGVDTITGMFAKLSSPVDFQSVDDRPVDLVFMLLAPEEAGADHLKALARVSRLLRDEKTCAKLRGTSDASALYAMLVGPVGAAA